MDLGGLHNPGYANQPTQNPANSTCNVEEPDKGTPQGSVVSSILANLFLHSAFDLWVTRYLPGVRFARYGDDGVLHCKNRRQAEYVLDRIREGMCDRLDNGIRMS